MTAAPASPIQYGTGQDAGASPRPDAALSSSA